MRISLALVAGLVLMSGCKYGGAPAGGGVSSVRVEVPQVQEQTAAQGYGEQRPGRRRSRRGRAEDAVAPGQFDFYLLNLSWSPEYCATHGSSPECGKGLGFVVHGLWPQDATGDYPEDCSDAPGLSDPGSDKDYPTAGLVEHEWQTHGTCSGLSAQAYFAAVHAAFTEVKLPNIPAGTVDTAVLVTRLQLANPGFPAGSFAVSCGNNRLTAVEVCLDKGLKGEACQGVRSCGARVITVTGR